MTQNSPRPNSGSRSSTADTGATDNDEAKAQPAETSSDAQPKGQSKDRAGLTAEIEQTRQQLGETVDALAAKADVGARVRDKAAQLREQTASSLGTLSQTVRQKAPQIRDQVAAPVVKAGQVIPEPARRTAVRTSRHTAQAASRRPGVLFVATAACVVAGLWLWRRGSRA
jgi:hypothetical protein